MMARFGVNVPPGIPVHSMGDLESAVHKMKDENGEVIHANRNWFSYCSFFLAFGLLWPVSYF